MKFYGFQKNILKGYEFIFLGVFKIIMKGTSKVLLKLS